MLQQELNNVRINKFASMLEKTVSLHCFRHTEPSQEDQGTSGLMM
jgi:hypothetical protein